MIVKNTLEPVFFRNMHRIILYYVVFFRCENIGFFNRCYEVEETQFMKLLEEYGVEVQK